MNMFKKNGGFTLVELIVVIAILAILAAVAVPAYNGYISKANDAAVQTELAGISTAVVAANATKSAIVEITTDDAVTFTITAKAGFDGKFKDNFELFSGKTVKSWSVTDNTGTLVFDAAVIDFTGSTYKTAGATYGANGWEAK